MKRLILLLCFVTYSLCSDENNQGRFRKYDGAYDYEYDDKNGDRDEIIEDKRNLCPKRDIHCVRRVLSEILQCTPLHEQRGDRYVFPDINSPIPQANASFITEHSITEGFGNFRINNLYINKRTNAIVFEVTLRSVTKQSVRSSLAFYQKGMEPIYTHDFFFIDHRDVSLTVTMNRRDTKNPIVHVYSYFGDPNLPIKLGPELTPRDPEALKQYAEIIKNLPLTLQEIFVIHGQYFFKLFLNTAICELGVKILPNY